MGQSASSGSNDVFDIRRVRRLVELMQDNELAELDIQQGDMRIQLKRNASLVHPPTEQVAAPTASPMVSQPAAPSSPQAAVADAEDVQLIKSPMVGTFYAASTPDSPPFAKVGDAVTPEKTVCLIEAMKVYNEIQAECSGQILAILVQNGASVEYGTPLFKVASSAK